MVRPSSRGGVPVFSRPWPSPTSAICSCQRDRRAFAAAAAFDHLLADEHAGAEEGAGGNHQRPAFDPAAVGVEAFYPAVAHDHGERLAGDELYPALRQQVGYRRLVQRPVGLEARAPNRRPLAAVEHAPVDCGAVGGAGHQPVEHVQLAHQMALANPADRRVA